MINAVLGVVEREVGGAAKDALGPARVKWLE